MKRKRRNIKWKNAVQCDEPNHVLPYEKDKFERIRMGIQKDMQQENQWKKVVH